MVKTEVQTKQTTKYKKSCLLKRDKEKKTFKVAKTEAESGDMWKQLTGNNKKRNETETDMR